MTLTNKQKQHLKNLAHHIKPTVLLGNNGLTEQVVVEINNTLEYHELIKIKLIGEDRQARQNLALKIAHATNSEIVQLMGYIVTLYRTSDNKKIKLSR